MKKVKIFDIANNPTISLEIAQILGEEAEIGRIRKSRFKDSEMSTDIPDDNIRGLEVFIFQSMNHNFAQERLELEYGISSLRSGSCKRITAVLPYLYSSRAERRTKKKQVIAAVNFARMLKGAGTKRAVTIDVHTEGIGGIYEALKMRIDCLELTPVYAGYWAQEMYKNPEETYVIASPDIGGAKRAKTLLDHIRDNCQIPLTARNYCVVFKEKIKDNVTEIIDFVGKVEDRNVIITDDIGDTLGTIINSAELLKKEGANKIYLNYTHAVHSEDANQRLITALDSGLVERVLLSDSIPLASEILNHEKIDVVPCAPLLAEYIRQVHKKSGGSVSQLHNYTNVMRLYADQPIFSKK